MAVNKFKMGTDSRGPLLGWGLDVVCGGGKFDDTAHAFGSLKSGAPRRRSTDALRWALFMLRVCLKSVTQIVRLDIRFQK